MKNLAVSAGAKMLKAMGNEKRLEILYNLSEQELNVGELEKSSLKPVCPVAAFGRFKSRKYCKNAAGGTDNILFNKKRQSIKGSSAAGRPLQQTLQILKTVCRYRQVNGTLYPDDYPFREI